MTGPVAVAGLAMRLYAAFLQTEDGQEWAECTRAVAEVAEAAPSATSTVCVRRGGYTPTASGFDGNQYAGVYFHDGDRATVHAYHPNVTPQYYSEVMAHEIGHAVDARLTPLERQGAMRLLGWDTWDGEHFADLYALHLGYWRDYGDGWRHPTVANQHTRGGHPPEVPYDLQYWFDETARMP